MRNEARFCFVIMPFKAELHYFYLYLRQHLESVHGLQVERADHRVLTLPLLDKIRDRILEADVVLADMTGRNPNVFYELGLAHAFQKPVVLLTQDDVQDVPSDVRHFEFIRYDLAKHEEFLAKLNNAIHHVLAERYDVLFTQATDLLCELNRDQDVPVLASSREEFQSRVIQGERTQQTLMSSDQYAMAEFLLPKIVQDPADMRIMRMLTEWINGRFGE